MAPLQRALLWICLLLSVAQVRCCSISNCANDAISNEGAFIECDMCICDGFDDFDDITEGAGACSTDQEDLFDCYVKYDASDATWSCTLRIKEAWIIGFIFMGCCLCCLGCGIFFFFSHRCCQKAAEKNRSESEMLINNTR